MFVGPPNGGKSNLLKVLGLFELDSIDHVDFRSFLRFENYSNLFYNNNNSEAIEVSLDDSEKLKIKLQNKQVLVRSESKGAIYLLDYKNGETIIHRMNDEDMHDATSLDTIFYEHEKFVPTGSHEKVKGKMVDAFCSRVLFRYPHLKNFVSNKQKNTSYKRLQQCNSYLKEFGLIKEAKGSIL